MDSIGPVLIPAIAALVGIVITALVTYLVGQERMSQRVERLANAREKLTDNGLLTRFIDLEIKAELLGSLRTRRTRFFMQVSSGFTILFAILIVVAFFLQTKDDSSFALGRLYFCLVLFFISYSVFVFSLIGHLKTKEGITIHQRPIR